MFGSIYMERNKSFKIHIILIHKATDFQKQFFFIVLNTYIYCFLLFTKIFYLLLNFLGKESTLESLYPTSSVDSQG